MKSSLAAAVIVMSVGSLALAQIAPKEWPPKAADLPPDGRVHFGALPNGLRYAWVNQQKAEEKEIYLRLFVDVGSLVEKDDEQGIAHFIEHMAFNGTKSFKGDTLVSWFQAHGVKFGHDVNAHTAADETVYEIDLPDGEAERLQKALAWMRDVTDGVLFDDKEVQKEKGVVDAEERERSSADLRIERKVELSLIDGTLYPKRWPIGVKTVRDKFDAARCKTFYGRWYRPENVIFLAAGNFGSTDIEKLIKDTFAGVTAPKDPMPARPAIGSVSVSSRAFCAYDKDARSFAITVVKVKPYAKEADGVAHRWQGLMRNDAFSVVNARLRKRAQKPGCPFDAASYGSWNENDLLQGHGLSVRCEPKKWKEALAEATRELRGALDGGITQDELKEQLRDLYNYYAAAPEADKFSPSAYLGRMLGVARGGSIPIDDKQLIELLKPMKSAYTLDQLNQLLRDSWKEGEVYVCAVGNLDLGTDASKALMAAWDAAQKEGPAASAADSGGGSTPEPKPVANWAYGAKSVEGRVTEAKDIADLKLTQITFANGVKAILRHSDKMQGGLLMFVRVGDGLVLLDPAEASLGWVASRTFLRGGLGQHEWDDVDRLTSGTGFGFGVGIDSCQFQGSAGWEQSQRLFEVICAYLTDPGFRPEPFERFMAELPRAYENVDKGPSGALNKFYRKLHSDDLRFTVPDRQMVESYLLDTVKEFLAPQLESGPVEIALVGGIPVDAVKRALARTFGMLPARQTREEHPEKFKTPALKSGLKLRQEIETDTKRATIRIVFPTTDGIDPVMRRKLYFLGEVIDDRLRVEVREKKGAAYSPSASSEASTRFPGLGSIEIEVEADPAKVDEVLNDCFAVTESLAKKGVKADEVERVRTVATTNHLKRLEDDGFWFGGMITSLFDPNALDDFRGAKTWYDGITANDVAALAKQYLPRAKASTCIIVPKKAAPAKKG